MSGNNMQGLYGWLNAESMKQEQAIEKVNKFLEESKEVGNGNV